MAAKLVTRKVAKDDLNHLILNGVKITSCVLGQGSYGTVYKADHNETACAAKQVDLSDKTHHGVVERVVQNFLLECLQHSKLRHPNIVKMLGVFYPIKQMIPVLVMELMDCNLTQLLEKHQNISMYIKLSILQDVSRGLCYLHTQNPPIVHQALYSDNILLTKGLLAKIGDFKTGAEAVSDQALLSTRRNRRSNDFLPRYSQEYSLEVNVFSFGCIVCHVITQEWPSELLVIPGNCITVSHIIKLQDGKLASYMVNNFWSIIKHQHYVDLISDSSLKQLAEACLQEYFKNRPPMSLICERITSIMTDYCNDDIKKIYALSMKQGLDQSKNFQLMLVGAENTGKTSLISSFLGYKFVKRQSATKGVDVEVCKVYCKDWVKISQSDKSNILHNQFSDQCKENILKKMADLSYASIYLGPRLSFYKYPSKIKSGIAHSDVLFTTVPFTKSMLTTPGKGNPHPQHVQVTPSQAIQYDSDSLIASLWDFAGQTVLHNSHSVFISDGGVSLITFNASMELTDPIILREGSPQLPECRTIISSIHYWLQVVNSVCSVKENVLLVGTHIDKLHSNIKKARKIISNKILPVLEKELCGKPYAQHIAYISEGLTSALKQSCFFVSNKCRDEEIRHLQAAAVAVAASLREEKPIFFLKIEQALLQLEEQVISVSTMLDLVVENTFPLDKNSPEFKGILKYFHNNRIILHFSQIESLKDLVILSPNWLAKLFSYVIAAQSYNTGGELDWAWKRLIKYGILHECLLQHMLDKFHSDYPVAGLIRVTEQQIIDILLCFHLVARITSKAWFAEEGFPPLPEKGDTFIVPSLVRIDDRNPPKTKQEKFVYFMFNSGFIPMSLLNQLIAECICRSVRRDDRLLWMRRGKMGSQLGADQKYYISRCEEKQSIQLTITVVGDDEEHIKERTDLINDITKILDDIMKMFMPATKERPPLLIPCVFCSVLHISLDDACSGKTMFCPFTDDDQSLPQDHYRDLLQGQLVDVTNTAHKLKRKPILQLLSRIKRHFAIHWRDIGYELLTATPEDIQIICSTDKTTDEKCFDMLKRWVETDADASYSKLIDALRVYNLNNAAKMVMDVIEKF